MNVKPLADRILVRRLEETETKRGGIIIPDTAKEKPQQAEVVAVGPRPRHRRGQARRSRGEGGATRSSWASTRAPRSRSTAPITSSCARMKFSPSSAKSIVGEPTTNGLPLIQGVISNGC